MKWKHIKLENNDEVLFDGTIDDLPLKEDYVISKSKELYNEPDPCIIYRTHIMKKLFLQILSRFPGKIKKGDQISCDKNMDLFQNVDINTDKAFLTIVK